MAKKSLLAGFKGKRAEKKKEAPKEKAAPKENPPAITDIVDFVVPGFAGYAGTRLVSRVAYGALMKRWPKLAKHGSVLSTFGAAGLAWLMVHRIHRLRTYHTPVVVGASIAAIQTAVQAYVPKYGWIVSDHNIQAPIVQPLLPQQRRAKVTANGTKVPLPQPVSSLSTPVNSTTNDELDELDNLDLGSLGDDIDGDMMSDEDLDDLLN